MVAVEVTRVGAEVAQTSDGQASTTRQSVSVLVPWGQSSGVAVEVTRLGLEVAVDTPEIASATRQSVSVLAPWGQASGGEVVVTRVAGEVAFSVPRTASVTRQSSSVLVPWGQASPATGVEVSRVAAEVAARNGFGAVEPLAGFDPDLDFFLHNWASAVVLQSSYNTAVSTSEETGAESRRGLGSRPLRRLSYEWLVEGREAVDRFFVQMRRLAKERISLPLYQDQTAVSVLAPSGSFTVPCDTTRRRFFVGQRVVLVRLDAYHQVESFEYLLIQSKTQTTLTFTTSTSLELRTCDRILPMIDCEIELQPAFQFLNRYTARAQIQLQEVPGLSQLPPLRTDLPPGFSTFEGLPIFEIEPDWSRGLPGWGIDRQGESGVKGRTARTEADPPRGRRSANLPLAMDRDDAFRTIEFFDTRQGRLRAFWLVDQESPWTLDSLGGAFVNVDEFGDLDDFREEFDAVGLVLKDGTTVVRNVVDILPVATTWQISVDPVLPGGLSASDVVRVARARKVRFRRDDMTETWLSGNAMTTTLGFIETLDEKDVTL